MGARKAIIKQSSWGRLTLGDAKKLCELSELSGLSGLSTGARAAMIKRRRGAKEKCAISAISAISPPNQVYRNDQPVQMQTVGVYVMVSVANIVVLGHVLPSHLLLNSQRLP
jgi:hypothetical protein